MWNYWTSALANVSQTLASQCNPGKRDPTLEEVTRSIHLAAGFHPLHWFVETRSVICLGSNKPVPSTQECT